MISSFDRSSDGAVTEWILKAIRARSHTEIRALNNDSSDPYPRLDRVLASALTKPERLKSHFGLKFQSYIEEFEACLRSLRGRVLLNLVVREFDPDSTYGTVVSELELFSMPAPEGSMQSLRAWRDKARYILSQLPTADRPSEKLLSKWLFVRLQKVGLLRRHTDKVRDSPEGAPERGFEWLWSRLERTILEGKGGQPKGKGGKGTGSPNNNTNKNKDGKDQEGKDKGKGKKISAKITVPGTPAPQAKPEAAAAKTSPKAAAVALVVAALTSGATASSEGPNCTLDVIGDTGAGEHLGCREAFVNQGVASNVVDQFCGTSSSHVAFETGGGKKRSNESIGVWAESLKTAANMFMLKSCPLVYSIGQFVMNQGYSFFWPTGEVPYLIPPIVEYKMEVDIDECRFHHECFGITWLE
eukprot:s1560_g16.t1